MSAAEAPIFAATEVHARDDEGERGASRGRVVGLNLASGAGIVAIVGTPEDGTLALASAASGHCPPLRGAVTVFGQAPSTSGSIRARIGVLPYTPRLPRGATVGQALALALRARRQTDGIDAVLDPLGLSALHARRTASLSYAETRALELALALTTPAPCLLVLHEPGCDVALIETPELYRRIRASARAGVCVLVTTSSIADARALGDRIARLDRGVLTWSTPTTTPIELIATVHAGLHELAAALEQFPEIRAVAWQEPATGPSTLRVRGAELDPCALCLTLAIAASGAVVESITPAAPASSSIGAPRP
jgi:ABC-2 type transport system ATP-binding protein